jgi:hypothetical protein
VVAYSVLLVRLTLLWLLGDRRLVKRIGQLDRRSLLQAPSGGISK